MRKYLFVCEDAEPLMPVIETAIKDYQEHLKVFRFEICPSSSIPSKGFSYFDRFDKIYSLNRNAISEIKKSFDIPDYKFHLIKLNRKDDKRNLENILFSTFVLKT